MDLDTSDREILLFITKGHTSSYSIWLAMKKTAAAFKGNVGAESKIESKKVMTYRNNNKRVIRLAQLGLIEEIKPSPHTVNIHGRKDYKVTQKGMEQLASYFLTHPDDVKIMDEYMGRFRLNKQAFGEMFMSMVTSAMKSTNEIMENIGHLEYAPTPTNILQQIQNVRESMIAFHNTLMEKEVFLQRQQSKQVVYSKSKTGHNQKFTTISVPKDKGYSEYGEQIQRQLERRKADIADSESQVDLYRRMTKPTHQSKKGLIPSTASPRKKKR